MADQRAIVQGTLAVRDALQAALAPLVVSRVVPGGVWWREFPGDAARVFPAIRVQPQDPGAPQAFLQTIGLEVTVAVLAFAASEDAAAVVLQRAADLIPDTATQGAFDLAFALDRPVAFPVLPGQSAKQAGLQYIVTIHPTRRA